MEGHTTIIGWVSTIVKIFYLQTAIQIFPLMQEIMLKKQRSLKPMLSIHIYLHQNTPGKASPCDKCPMIKSSVPTTLLSTGPFRGDAPNKNFSISAPTSALRRLPSDYNPCW
ncbi:hypothetical protein H5410_027538 [Solanum commersonii]|uniref:Uncharacterized protein n=1 Tax=Solanum commersonii TaxID=4109 RepID=A0A9J5Z4R5_SOLCO|nr:hypothetical protein H5410_027538 [Solanum commersonii]